MDAKREFERQSDLFKKKLSAESLLDAARFAYETAQAEYQVKLASLQAPTLFSIADDLTHMQVEADVDEAFIGQVKQGQSVNFTVFAYPERHFKGKVSQVRLQPKVDAGVSGQI